MSFQYASVWDLIVLVCLCINTVLLSVIFIVILCKKQTVAPLRFKQPFYVYGLIVFGITTPWAIFVSNDHLDALDGLQAYDCALWSYWLSHVFGINMWFVFMTMRLLDKLFIFHKPLSSWSSARKLITRATVFLTLTLPLVLLAANVSWAHWSQFDSDLRTCVSVHVETKLALVVWYCLCFVTFNVLFRYVESDIHNAYFVDYMTLNDTSFVAQYVFVANILINLFGVVHQMYGRTLYTLNIVLLFTFTILRLTGKSVWLVFYNLVRCWRKSDSLASSPATTTTTMPIKTMMYDIQFVSLAELEMSSDLMDGYFDFAHRKTNDPLRRRQLEYIINCLRDIAQLSRSYTPIFDQHTIIKQYFSLGCMFDVALPTHQRMKVLSTCDVRLARLYLLDFLQKHFFGTQYLALVNGDAERVFDIRRPWQTQRALAPPEKVAELMTENEWQQCEFLVEDVNVDSNHRSNNNNNQIKELPTPRLAITQTLSTSNQERLFESDSSSKSIRHRINTDPTDDENPFEHHEQNNRWSLSTLAASVRSASNTIGRKLHALRSYYAATNVEFL